MALPFALPQVAGVAVAELANALGSVTTYTPVVVQDLVSVTNNEYVPAAKFVITGLPGWAGVHTKVYAGLPPDMVVLTCPVLLPLQLKLVTLDDVIVNGFGCVMVTVCDVGQPLASVTAQV